MVLLCMLSWVVFGLSFEKLSSVAQKVECKFYFVCSYVCLLCYFNVDVVFFLLVKKGGAKRGQQKVVVVGFFQKVFGGLFGIL